MAWTAPATVTTAQVMTASFWNTHVRDNLLETMVAKMQAAGDMAYASAANALARLAIGSPYRGLGALGSSVAWNVFALRQAPLFTSATGVNSGTTDTAIVSQAITTTGGPVLIIVEASISEAKSATGSFAHLFFLERGTTILANDTQIGYVGNASVNARQPTTLFYLDAPAAGTYTYRASGLYTNVSTSGTPTAQGLIFIAEFS